MNLDAQCTAERITNPNLVGGPSFNWSGTGWDLSNPDVSSYSAGGGIIFRRDSQQNNNLSQTINNVNPQGNTSPVFTLQVGPYDSAPATLSQPMTFEMSYAGTLYMRISTQYGVSASAAVTYFNGASGSHSTVPMLPSGTSSGVTATMTVMLPSNVTNSGSLNFRYNTTTGIPGDDITLRSVSLTTTIVTPTPTISAGGATTFCTGGSVILTSSSTTGNQWYKDGAIISGATAQTYTATTSGTYTVIVTTGGCASSPSTGTVVTVNPIPPTPTISAGGATTFCAGGSVILTSSSATGNQWYKDGSIIPGATAQSYIFNTSGTYTVIVTTSGCSSAASAGTTVTVNPTPATPSISAGGPTTFCTGGSVVLTSSSTTGNQWYRNGSIIPGATAQSYIFNTSGTYTVIVTTGGCSSAASAGTTVTVNSIPPTPTISAGGPTTFCTGGSVVLTSSSATGNQWYKDGSIIPGATAQSYIFNTSGTYTVIVTTSGCSSSASAGTTVTVNSIPPQLNVTAGGPTALCTGGSVQLTADYNTTGAYQWYRNGTIIPGAIFYQYTATTAGTYTVTRELGGCTSPASAGVNVTVNICQPNFGNCSAKMFLTRVVSGVSTLYEVNYATTPFTYTSLGTGTLPLNAMVFNPLDNYLYGLYYGGAILGGYNHLIRIGSDGSTVDLGSVSGVDAFTSHDNGAISPSGDFYVIGGNSFNELYKINIATRTATTINMNMGVQAADIAWYNGLLYGIDNGKLVSINPVSGIVTIVGNSSPSIGAVAVWSFNNALYVTNGSIMYIIDPATGAATVASSAPPEAAGDGASCPTASIKLDTDLSVTKTNTPASGANDQANDTYIPGEIRKYTVVVSNSATGFGAQNITVNDPVPAGINAATVSWKCTPTSGGAVCGAAIGTGALNDTGLALPPGAVATYEITMTVPTTFTGALTNIVSITPPSNINDTNATNNTATDTDVMPYNCSGKIYSLDNNGEIKAFTNPVSSGALGAVINTTPYPVATTEANALGYSNLTGKFYYVQTQGGAVANNTFVSYDPIANTYQTLAGTNGFIYRGTVTNDGTGYYAITQGNTLKYYNISANTWTIITNNYVDQNGNNLNTIMSTYNGGDIAMDGNGDLWILAGTVSSPTAYIFRVKNTVPTTSLGATPLVLEQIAKQDIGNSPNGIAFSAAGELLITNASTLFKMNNNFSIVSIGPVTNGASGDLASCAYPIPFAISDFGDAPDTYKTVLASNGAQHTVSLYDATNNTSALMIGSKIDLENDGFPNANANGDDTNNINDENSVTLPVLTTVDTSYSITVPVVNSTGVGANIKAWIDFNKNGIFDAAESVTAVVANGATSVTLTWTALSGLTLGDTYYRIRIAKVSSEIANPTGVAVGGEVEDGKITISAPSYCTKPGDFSLAGIPTKMGITTQTKLTGWPENVPNGHITLESKESGFVITRVAQSSAVTDPKEGMIVYDIAAQCVKLYNGTAWKCIQRSCNN
ncbi:hypothetical protein C1638_004125 [Chryseobacterium oncorhynchi]|uniref:PKD/Chitinase domain-containing protein n=2 Tax=Chryseobacterium oncorhynchi TaxID=741074 RepID=A0A316X1R5_9FLAO|nr:hypothetical protein C1638_004125 [Chryseobacterium oncorhynchi]